MILKQGTPKGLNKTATGLGNTIKTLYCCHSFMYSLEKMTIKFLLCFPCNQDSLILTSLQYQQHLLKHQVWFLLFYIPNSNRM